MYESSDVERAKTLPELHILIISHYIVNGMKVSHSLQLDNLSHHEKSFASCHVVSCHGGHDSYRSHGRVFWVFLPDQSFTR